MRPTSLILAVLVGCGAQGANAPHVRMTPKDIVVASSAAIVRIEAGEKGDRIGTGFVVDKAGLIATNLHVIAGQQKIEVQVDKDGTSYPAISVAGVDKIHDLALIWISPKHPLNAVKLGDSAAVSVGDPIVAIGNPLGLFDHTVSAGLISQVRPLSTDITILQISAPISPGSSGGALFNQFGEVIGVTTMIANGGQNINFAMPCNYLRPMLAQRAQIALGDFATQTKDEDPEAKKSGEPENADDDSAQIIRKVPVHPLTVWDGCSLQDVENVVKTIGDAIGKGAPSYNSRQVDPGEPGFNAHGFEVCFDIYEAAATKLEQEAPCKGVRSAFGDGLLRAKSASSFKEKAWVMRDTFDGMIDVAHRWVEKQQTAPASKPSPKSAK